MKEKNIPQAFENKCPECGSSNLVYDQDSGEISCGDCGLVIGQDISQGPEWRAFDKEQREQRSRVGAPREIGIHDQGMGTKINPWEGDALQRKIPSSTRFQMWRLSKLQTHMRVQSSVEHNLSKAMAELTRLSEKLGIPKPVHDQAAYIYRKALEYRKGDKKNLVRGRSINAMTPASLYAACRISGVERTIAEIAKISTATEKDIFRCYRLLVRELELQTLIASPLTSVSKIAGRARLPGEILMSAINILQRAREKHISGGKSPTGQAAAALYIACKLNGRKDSQSDIADAAGVTEVTVRNRFKPLKEGLGIRFPGEVEKKPKVEPPEKEQPKSEESSITEPEPKKNIASRTHEDCIAAIATKADISQETQKVALQILNQVEGSEFLKPKGRKSPDGVAGAILYEACQQTGEMTRQLVIARAAGVHLRTLGTRWRELNWMLLKEEKELELSQPKLEKSEEQSPQRSLFFAKFIFFCYDK